MAEYKEFKIVIENRAKISVTKPNGINRTGDIQLSALKERTINIFNNWLANDKIENREELVVLGTSLYNVLFDPAMSKEFKEEYDKVIKEQPSPVLRVVLEFKLEAQDLAKMPWEYIYYPDNVDGAGRGFFIATDSQLILARHVPLVKGVGDQKPLPKPLRILIVAAKPERTPAGEALKIVVSDPIIQTIKALKKLHPDAIEIKEMPDPNDPHKTQPSKRVLSETVQKFQPHVLHFIGHGEYEKGKDTDTYTGHLLLVNHDEPKISARINDAAFADCFRNKEPRLIFLHACEGARTDSYAAFRGVALQLAYSRVPAVVAMQYEIKNSMATQFANKFYESLGKGKPIDVAVQDGRMELGMFTDEEQNFSNRAFGSPVVFLQNAAGIIIAEAQPEADLPLTAQSPPGPVIAGPERCPYGEGCPGMMYQDSTFCVKCRRPVTLCPNGHIMAKQAGLCCPKCGYPEIQTGAPSARVNEAAQPVAESVAEIRSDRLN
jgi:CHAT domain-containing protein